jgi:hypothetical protein
VMSLRIQRDEGPRRARVSKIAACVPDMAGRPYVRAFSFQMVLVLLSS